MWRSAQKVPFPKNFPSSSKKSPKVRFQSNSSQESKKGGVGKTVVALIGVTTLSAGGVVAYAKYDPNFRKKLEENIPYSENVLKSIPDWNEISSLPEKGKAAIEPITTGIKEKVFKPFTSSDEPKPTEEGLLKKKLERDAKKKEEANLISPPPLPPVTTSWSEKDVTPSKEIKKSAESAKVKKISDQEMRRRLAEQESHSLELNDQLERKLKNNLSSIDHLLKYALDTQYAAIQAIKLHTQKLYLALDSTEQIENEENAWKEANAAMADKISKMEAVNSKMTELKEIVKYVKDTIKEGRESKITAENAVLISSEEHVNKALSEVETAEKELLAVQAESNVAAHYRQMVEKGREQFRKELEAIVPNVKIGEKGNKLTEDELNFLIVHAHRRVEKLHKQLAKQQVTEQERVQKALVQQKEEDEKVAESVVQAELNRQQRELEIEFQKQVTNVKNEFENELRQQLRRQAAAHSDHLQEVLEVQRKHLDRKLEVALQEKVIEERSQFQNIIEKSFTKLNEMEEKLKVREELDRAIQKAQELWLACQSLKESIQGGHTELRPLSVAVKTIRNSVDPNNEFILSILDSIPKEALVRGVYTEEVLKERFKRVDKICRRVALVDDDHRSLYHYCLSYLQSFLIIDNNKISKYETDIDVSQWNTFDILGHIRQSISHGNLQQALRYANQLTGEPKNIAKSWINETILLLETKQVVNAIIAYAEATSIQAYH